MVPNDAILLFSVLTELANHFMTSHYPHPPLLRSICGIGYASKNVSKTAGNSAIAIHSTVGQYQTM